MYRTSMGTGPLRLFFTTEILQLTVLRRISNLDASFRRLYTRRFGWNRYFQLLSAGERCGSTVHALVVGDDQENFKDDAPGETRGHDQAGPPGRSIGEPF